VHIDDVVLCKSTAEGPPPNFPVPSGLEDIEFIPHVQAVWLCPGERIPNEEPGKVFHGRCDLPGVPIERNGTVGGTPFDFSEKGGSGVALTAPGQFANLNVQRWEMGDSTYYAKGQRTLSWVLSRDVTVTAVYGEELPRFRAQVELGEMDLEDGVVNSVRANGTDGENQGLECGPPADRRNARLNWGTQDPTADLADHYFYFNVVNPRAASSSKPRIRAYLYDDPALPAGTTISLQYTNSQATGPTDLPDVFALHPVDFNLGQSGSWIKLEWEVDDAGFDTFPNDFDFRLAADVGQVSPTQSKRFCLDSVVVETPIQ
jgi:hypothetical protein